MKAHSAVQLTLDWATQTYDSLNSGELQEIFRVREEVFIVEQQCVYQDVDSLDEKCSHITARDNSGKLMAYARILPPGLKDQNASFGRVLVIKEQRNKGIGKKLVQLCIDECQRKYPDAEFRISAQAHLVDFYRDFGFEAVGTPYDDAGISHIDMILQLEQTAD